MVGTRRKSFFPVSLPVGAFLVGFVQLDGLKLVRSGRPAGVAVPAGLLCLGFAHFGG